MMLNISKDELSLLTELVGREKLKRIKNWKDYGMPESSALEKAEKSPCGHLLRKMDKLYNG